MHVEKIVGASPIRVGPVLGVSPPRPPRPMPDIAQFEVTALPIATLTTAL
jgi:hypothetical protein